MRIPLHDIARWRTMTVVSSFGLRPFFATGLELTLRTGETQAFALGFMEAPEILEQFRRHTKDEGTSHAHYETPDQ